MYMYISVFLSGTAHSFLLAPGARIHVKLIILVCCYYLTPGKEDTLETIEEKTGEKRTIFETNEKSKKMEAWKK